jgi:16S rRNA (guanine966-N2)-methyltransferase
MTLKIIGGLYKNHRLETPEGALTKPTMSLMRKSLFDSLQAYIEGALFLDVFACSGAVGIEALSRGAKASTFIDSDRKACRCIEGNLKALKLTPQGTVLTGDALTVMERLAKAGASFDIIFLDPPYTHSHDKSCSPKELLKWLDNSTLIKEGGLIFLEEAYPATLKEDMPELIALIHKDSRKFSSSSLHRFSKKTR